MFKPDTTFNSSHKMGDAKITLAKALEKFGEGDTDDCDGKVANYWGGSFTTQDGTVRRASFWNWKGSLNYGGYVSVWISKPEYLPEFIRFIEA